MSSSIRPATAADVARLLFVGAIWGGSFIFISLALKSLGPISIAGWRIALAAIILLAINGVLKQKFPSAPSVWGWLVFIGLLNSALPFFLINWGQQFVSSAETALLVASGTFCALLLSHFVSTDERINRYRLMGVLVGFSGVVVLVVVDLLESGLGAIKGQLAIILAGCSYATSSVFARRVSFLHPVTLSATTMLSACIYMLPLAFILENPLPEQISIDSMLAVLYLGLIGTAYAFVLRFKIIQTNGAVFMAQVGYLVPLFGVLWGALFLSDIISTETWIALGLILAGIAITRQGAHRN